MTPKLNIIEIESMIPNRIVKKIVFTESGLTIETPLSFDRKLFIANENIEAFRFGVHDMHLGKLHFCRQYFIETRDFKDKVSRIKLNNYFGKDDETYYNAWADTLQRFWDFYMVDHLSYYKELFHLHQSFELSGITFHADGISWDAENKLTWNEIAVNSYKNYFVVHHVDNPNQCKCFVFAINWNALVLQSLLKDVIQRPVVVYKRSSI